MNEPDFVTSVGATRFVPSGFVIETFACVIVTDDDFKLMRWPAEPVNVCRAFCPGVVVVTVTGAPPGVIEPETSGGTSYSVRVMLPV